MYLTQAYIDWRTTKRWHSEAARLGLTSTGKAPALGLVGEFRGVTVEVEHHVEERYKQSPLVTYVARACVSEACHSRSLPEPTPEDILTGSVEADWFKHSGRGVFGRKQLESCLLALVIAARQSCRDPAQISDESELHPRGARCSPSRRVAK